MSKSKKLMDGKSVIDFHKQQIVMIWDGCLSGNTMAIISVPFMRLVLPGMLLPVKEGANSEVQFASYDQLEKSDLMR